MNGTFVETRNVANFRKAINGLMNRDHYQPGFMVVEGESGRGKSMAADNWFAVHGGVYFRVWEGLTQHAFLQELAFEVLNMRPHGASNCKRMIVEQLKGSQAVIIVDEADRLALPRLEDLRDIHEASGATIVLIGEDGLLGKVGQKKRIYSRVAEVVTFEGVQKEDVVMYGATAADLTISPEAAALLVKKSDGSFRMVHNYMLKIADYAQANKLSAIDANHVELLKLKSLGVPADSFKFRRNK